MEDLSDFKVVLFGLNGTRWLGNRLLHAVMEKRGFCVYSIFFRETYQSWAPIEDNERKYILEILQELKPGLVGFSLTSFYVNEAKELTLMIKKHFDVPIIWGGIHPSLNPDDCMKYADMVCIGEGEEALPELASSISNKEARTDIKNVWFKQNGNIIRNSNRALIEDFDLIPFPDFHNKNKYYLVSNKLYKEYNPSPYYRYEYNIMTCRGCPYKCTYCSNHKTSKMGHGKMLRRRSIDNVMEELRLVIADFPKIRKIYFWDDVFPYDKKWLREFVKSYKKDIKIPFFCYVHPTLIDEDRVVMLKEMGIEELAMGFQHGSSRIRKGYFERHESDEAILKAIALFQKYKIKLHLDMLSTPFDNEQDNHENMQLLLKVPKPFSLYMHTLTFFPGYKITERALEEKVITEKQVVGEDFRKEIGASKKEISGNPWLCYEALMGKGYIPNRFVHFMIRKNFHYKYVFILKTLAEMCVRLERIKTSYENNKTLLKNMEFSHFISMFGYIKTFFRQR